MKIRFRDVLSAQDREHLRRILDVGHSTVPLSKVVHFLQEAAYIEVGAIQAFKELAQGERERLISEFVWRVACHLEGSVTRVLGVSAYPLGKQFWAVHAPHEGQDIICLALTL